MRYCSGLCCYLKRWFLRYALWWMTSQRRRGSFLRLRDSIAEVSSWRYSAEEGVIFGAKRSRRGLEGWEMLVFLAKLFYMIRAIAPCRIHIKLLENAEQFLRICELGVPLYWNSFHLIQHYKSDDGLLLFSFSSCENPFNCLLHFFIWNVTFPFLSLISTRPVGVNIAPSAGILFTHACSSLLCIVVED